MLTRLPFVPQSQWQVLDERVIDERDIDAECEVASCRALQCYLCLFLPSLCVPAQSVGTWIVAASLKASNNTTLS